MTLVAAVPIMAGEYPDGNDTFETATPITFEKTIEGVCTSREEVAKVHGDGRDYDYYTFTLKEKAICTFDFAPAAGATASEIGDGWSVELFCAHRVHEYGYDSITCMNWNPLKEARSTTMALLPDKYLIRIYGGRKQYTPLPEFPAAHYTLKVSCTTKDIDRWIFDSMDPLEEKATAIELDKEYYGSFCRYEDLDRVMVKNPEDYDWIVFDVKINYPDWYTGPKWNVGGRYLSSHYINQGTGNWIDEWRGGCRAEVSGTVKNPTCEFFLCMNNDEKKQFKILHCPFTYTLKAHKEYKFGMKPSERAAAIAKREAEQRSKAENGMVTRLTLLDEKKSRSLNGTTLRLKAGKKYEIKIIPWPENKYYGYYLKLQYSSSDKTVATVKGKPATINGITVVKDDNAVEAVIRARKKGTCWITAKAKNGKKAKVKIVVR